jgi:hypothetical protein
MKQIADQIQEALHHQAPEQGGLITYGIAAIGAFVGSLTASDVLVWLSILLALIRLPIELHRLYVWWRKLRTEGRAHDADPH